MFIDLRGANGSNGRDGTRGRDGKDGSTWKDSNGKTHRGAGGDGTNGGNGTNGINGEDGKSFSGELLIEGQIVVIRTPGSDHKLTQLTRINTSGGDGGDGGDGGRGGSGGRGDPRGDHGQDGIGGSGGDGGNAGDISIHTSDSHLLGMIICAARGGVGGKEGSGKPRGERGNNGSDGHIRFRHNLGNRGIEEDSSFGIDVDDVIVTDDGSMNNGSLAQNSIITIESVSLSNSHRISVLAPYQFKIEKSYISDPFDIMDNNQISVDFSLRENQKDVVYPKVIIKVLENAEPGFYGLRLMPYSQKCGLEIDLSENHSVFQYDISINHRLSDNCIRCMTDDDETRKQFIDYFNKQSPDNQTTIIYYLLYRDLVRNKPTSSPSGSERVDAAILNADGGLVKHSLFKELEACPLVNNTVEDGLLQPWRIAEDFFIHISKRNVETLFSTLFVIATCDMHVDSNEKSKIGNLARKLKVEDNFLTENAPWLFTSDSTTLKARATNVPYWIFALLLSSLATHLGMWFVMSTNDYGEIINIALPSILNVWWMTQFLDLSSGGLLGLVLGFTVIYIIVIGIVSHKFKMACPSCYSIRLKKESYYSVRCLDCGLISGNANEGIGRQPLHSDGFLYDNPSIVRKQFLYYVNLILAAIVFF